MDFELSEEQELMRNGLRELLERACDASRVRAVAYDGDGRDPELWLSLAEAGWTGIAVPESGGGAGGRFEDLILVFEEAGRAVLPSPLTTTLLATRAISRSAASPQRDELLSRIASGASSVTLALSTRPDLRDSHGCTALPDGDTWRLSGSIGFVPHGPLAGLALIEASLPDGKRALLLMRTDARGASWAELQLMDRSTRHYDLALDNAQASLLIDDAAQTIDALVQEWSVALAAESLGAAQRMLELTVAYAKERVQFGRPIGTNQAVKWRVADMGAAVERMRAAVYHAAVKIDDAGAEDLAVAVAMAKAATAAPGAFVASQAIHVHGGIGFTWEHDLHLYFKRIKSNELLLGDGAYHLARIADAVLALRTSPSSTGSVAKDV